MKIALVSSKKSVVQVIPRIAEILRQKIIGVEVTERLVDSNLDIVKEVSYLGGFDAVAVVLFYEEDSTEVKVLMEKLVDLELSGSRIMKFLEKGEDFTDEEEAQRISGEIMQKLFGKKDTKTEEDYGSYRSL